MLPVFDYLKKLGVEQKQTLFEVVKARLEMNNKLDKTLYLSSLENINTFEELKNVAEKEYNKFVREVKEILKKYDFNQLFEDLKLNKIKSKIFYDLLKTHGIDNFIELLNETVIEENIVPMPLSKLSIKEFKEEFLNKNGIVIDFETNTIELNKDVEMILFSAIDTATGETITEMDKLLQKLHNRLVVSFTDFDIRVLVNESKKYGYKYISTTTIVSSKSKKLVYAIKMLKDNNPLEFMVWDLANIFTGLKLKDIAQLVDTHITNNIVEDKTNDLISLYKKIGQGKGLEFEGIKADELKKIKEENKSFSEADFEEHDEKIIAKNDVAVKLCLFAKNINPAESQEYKDYNLKDTLITAIAYIEFENIFKKGILGEEIKKEFGDIKIERKITIPSLAYNIVAQICKQNTIEKIKKGLPLKLLQKYEKKKDFKDLPILHEDERVIIYKNDNPFSILITHKKKNKNYVIKYTKTHKIFRKAYTGGIVYFKDKLLHEANETKKIVQYDINSSYPTSMVALGIEPFAKLHMVYPYENYKLKKLLDNIQTNEEMLPMKRSMFNTFISCKLYEKYPNLYRLLEKAVFGEVVVIADCLIKRIPKKTHFGLSYKIKNQTVNAYGNIYERRIINILDLMRINADVDLERLFIAESTNHILPKFIEKCYKQRIAYKKEKNPLQNTIKLFLNSSYGKFGSKSLDEFKINSIKMLSRFKKTTLLLSSIKNKTIKHAIAEKLNEIDNTKISFKFNRALYSITKTNCLVKIIKKCKNSINITKFILNKSGSSMINKIIKKYENPKTNVMIASTITAYSRMLLAYYKVRLEERGCVLINSDTDSLLVEQDKLQEIDFGNELGALKKENEFTSVKCFAKKSYIADNIVKCKGADKNAKKELLEQIKENKDNFQVHMLQKTKLGEGVFKTITKNIRVCKYEGLVYVDNPVPTISPELFEKTTT